MFCVGCLSEIDGGCPTRTPMLDEDEGGWLPFAVAVLLLALAGWGLFSIPDAADDIHISESTSADEVPPTVEWFTHVDCQSCHQLEEDTTGLRHDIADQSNPLWFTWHHHDDSLDSSDSGYDELGIVAGQYRAEDLDAEWPGLYLDGEPVGTDALSLRDALLAREVNNASADLGLTMQWVGTEDELILNVSISLDLSETLSNTTLLQMYILEDSVDIEGHTPAQVAIVKLYRFTIAFNHNSGESSIHWETIPEMDLPRYDLPEDARDSNRLRFVVLLRDDMTNQVFAATSAQLPAPGIGPSNHGDRVAVLAGLAIILFSLAGVSRAEWRRERHLPSLSGRMERRGDRVVPVAVLQAKASPITLTKVVVEEPWRLSSRIKEISLRENAERTFDLMVKEARGHQPSDSDPVISHWSVKVEGMGGWVLDLSFDMIRPP